jgi:glycosyltransferase involved in cell wall biosynthesis
VRILFLSTSMGLGGADSQLLSAALGLRGRGHEVCIVSLTALGPMGLQARQLGLDTRSLEMPRGVPAPGGLARLRRIVREWRPDVVHSHMVHANLMARALRLVAPVPALVSTIHNVYEGGPVLMAGYRLSNRLVDHMTIISQVAADRFIRERIVPRELLSVIPNGVDPEPYGPAAREAGQAQRRLLGLGQRFVWIAVGRFEVAKDYPNMLRAFAAVHKRRPEAVLLLVGRGSLKDEVERLAQELGLGSAVRFTGPRDDVPALLAAADGYVMSSAWEGMPMVILEASAAGLPIVATRAGGIGEVVVEGKTGFLVEPRDAQALGNAMVRLMGLPEAERRQMGANGRQRIHDGYTLARVVDQWEDVYRRVLTRKGIVPEIAQSSPERLPVAR